MIPSIHQARLDNAENLDDNLLANMADSAFTLAGDDAEPSASPADPSD